MVIQTDTVRIREGNNNKAYFINASFTETIFTVWKMPKKSPGKDSEHGQAVFGLYVKV